MDMEGSEATCEEHNINCTDKKKSQTSQMLQPGGPAHNAAAAAQEGSTLSTADPQANCEAPVCLRDATPRAPVPGSSVLSAGGYQATLQLQTHVVLSATGSMHQSQLLLSGGREYDFEGGWGKVAVNEGDLYITHPLDCCRSAGWYLEIVFEENSGI